MADIEDVKSSRHTPGVNPEGEHAKEHGESLDQIQLTMLTDSAQDSPDLLPRQPSSDNLFFRERQNSDQFHLHDEDPTEDMEDWHLREADKTQAKSLPLDVDRDFLRFREEANEEVSSTTGDRIRDNFPSSLTSGRGDEAEEMELEVTGSRLDFEQVGAAGAESFSPVRGQSLNPFSAADRLWEEQYDGADQSENPAISQIQGYDFMGGNMPECDAQCEDDCLGQDLMDIGGQAAGRDQLPLREQHQESAETAGLAFTDQTEEIMSHEKLTETVVEADEGYGGYGLEQSETELYDERKQPCGKLGNHKYTLLNDNNEDDDVDIQMEPVEIAHRSPDDKSVSEFKATDGFQNALEDGLTHTNTMIEHHAPQLGQDEAIHPFSTQPTECSHDKEDEDLTECREEDNVSETETEMEDFPVAEYQQSDVCSDPYLVADTHHAPVESEADDEDHAYDDRISQADDNQDILFQYSTDSVTRPENPVPPTEDIVGNLEDISHSQQYMAESGSDDEQEYDRKSCSHENQDHAAPHAPDTAPNIVQLPGHMVQESANAALYLQETTPQYTHSDLYPKESTSHRMDNVLYREQTNLQQVDRGLYLEELTSDRVDNVLYQEDSHHANVVHPTESTSKQEDNALNPEETTCSLDYNILYPVKSGSKQADTVFDPEEITSQLADNALYREEIECHDADTVHYLEETICRQTNNFPSKAEETSEPGDNVLYSGAATFHEVNSAFLQEKTTVYQRDTASHIEEAVQQPIKVVHQPELSVLQQEDSFNHRNDSNINDTTFVSQDDIDESGFNTLRTSNKNDYHDGMEEEENATVGKEHGDVEYSVDARIELHGKVKVPQQAFEDKEEITTIAESETSLENIHSAEKVPITYEDNITAHQEELVHSIEMKGERKTENTDGDNYFYAAAGSQKYQDFETTKDQNAFGDFGLNDGNLNMSQVEPTINHEEKEDTSQSSETEYSREVHQQDLVKVGGKTRLNEEISETFNRDIMFQQQLPVENIDSHQQQTRNEFLQNRNKIQADEEAKDCEIISEGNRDHDISSEDTGDHEISSEDTGDHEIIGGDARDNEISSADTRHHEIISADTRDHEISSADTGDHEIRSADTRDHEISSTDTRDHEISSEDTRDQDISSADTRDYDITSADTRDPEINSADTIDHDITSENTSDHEINNEGMKDHVIIDEDTRENELVSEEDKAQVGDFMQHFQQDKKTAESLDEDAIEYDREVQQWQAEQLEDNESVAETTEDATCLYGGVPKEETHQQEIMSAGNVYNKPNFETHKTSDLPKDEHVMETEDFSFNCQKDIQEEVMPRTNFTNQEIFEDQQKEREEKYAERPSDFTNFQQALHKEEEEFMPETFGDSEMEEDSRNLEKSHVSYVGSDVLTSEYEDRSYVDNLSELTSPETIPQPLPSPPEPKDLSPFEPSASNDYPAPSQEATESPQVELIPAVHEPHESHDLTHDPNAADFLTVGEVVGETRFSVDGTAITSTAQNNGVLHSDEDMNDEEDEDDGSQNLELGLTNTGTTETENSTDDRSGEMGGHEPPGGTEAALMSMSMEGSFYDDGGDLMGGDDRRGQQQTLLYEDGYITEESSQQDSYDPKQESFMARADQLGHKVLGDLNHQTQGSLVPVLGDRKDRVGEEDVGPLISSPRPTVVSGGKEVQTGGFDLLADTSYAPTNHSCDLAISAADPTVKVSELPGRQDESKREDSVKSAHTDISVTEKPSVTVSSSEKPSSEVSDIVVPIPTKPEAGETASATAKTTSGKKTSTKSGDKTAAPTAAVTPKASKDTKESKPAAGKPTTPKTAEVAATASKPTPRKPTEARSVSAAPHDRRSSAKRATSPCKSPSTPTAPAKSNTPLPSYAQPIVHRQPREAKTPQGEEKKRKKPRAASAAALSHKSPQVSTTTTTATTPTSRTVASSSGPITISSRIIELARPKSSPVKLTNGTASSPTESKPTAKKHGSETKNGYGHKLDSTHKSSATPSTGSKPHAKSPHAAHALPSPKSEVKSKIGSLDNTTHVPGGGQQVKMTIKKADYTNVSSKIGSKDNMDYKPGGGKVKIENKKLKVEAKSKIGSLENATHKPGGGDKKIEVQKTEWKANSKVGSLDKVKHKAGANNQVEKTDVTENGVADKPTCVNGSDHKTAVLVNGTASNI